MKIIYSRKIGTRIESKADLDRKFYRKLITPHVINELEFWYVKRNSFDASLYHMKGITKYDPSLSVYFPTLRGMYIDGNYYEQSLKEGEYMVIRADPN